MRQVAKMLVHIDRRIHNEFVSHAALQGVKLPLRGEQETIESGSLTADEEALMMKSLEEAQIRKLKRG